MISVVAFPVTGARLDRKVRAGVALVAGLALLGGCGQAKPADTSPVLLAEGRVGDQPWRLEGRRMGGEPCASLLLVGSDGPAADRCGIRSTPLRHLDPVNVSAGGRVLVFSPLPDGARRVRLDAPDGSIRLEPARTAPGFPARFFVVDLDPKESPKEVRAFAQDGRMVAR